jgi:hypothetical protein
MIDIPLPLKEDYGIVLVTTRQPLYLYIFLMNSNGKMSVDFPNLKFPSHSQGEPPLIPVL